MGERVGSDGGEWPWPKVSRMTQACRECGSAPAKQAESFRVSVTLCEACAAKLKSGDIAYRVAHEEGAEFGTARLERKERGGKWRKAPRPAKRKDEGHEG